MSTCKRMWTDREVRSMAVDSVEEKEDLEVFEHIVDNDGNPRFVEGDITIQTITGVSKVYGKWSLSGTHLMIVLVISIADTSVLNGRLFNISDMPKYITDKILATPAGFIDQKTFVAFASDSTSQNIFTQLFFGSPGVLSLNTGSVTATKDRECRMSFDLLIDND